MNHSRKHKFITSLLILLSLSTAHQGLAQDPALEDFTLQSRSITANFTAALIRTCELEVESLGLHAATEVCRITAPQVYYEHSIKNHIILNLVSLNPRNPVTGHADACEQAGLLKMQQLLDQGHNPDTIEIAALVKEPAETYYRYMKPMIATPFCLKCHGTEQHLSRDLVNTIKHFYPDDHSFGYQLGELMGAVSIKKIYTPPANNR